MKALIVITMWISYAYILVRADLANWQFVVLTALVALFTLVGVMPDSGTSEKSSGKKKMTVH